MSSLAAARADNFYRPPDFDPKNRKKEIERKKRLGKWKERKHGARVIRFEMPFHIRCDGCKIMIAKGVRFNAEKKKVGKYLSTHIFQFSMRCDMCKNIMVIRTDPEKIDYQLVSGCVKYEVDYEEENIGTIKVQQRDEGEAILKNPLLKLEIQKLDKIKGDEQKPILAKLYEEKKIFRDDYFLNKTLRRKLKMEKEEIRKVEEKKNSVKNFALPLLDYNSEDELIAKNINFKQDESRLQRFNKRDEIRLESIFKPTFLEKEYLIKKKHCLNIGVQKALENLKHLNKAQNLKNDTDWNSFSKNIIIKKKT